MTTIEWIYVGIAFVIFASPIVFYRFTRLDNPANYQDRSSFLGNLGRILFLLSLPLYFGICSLASSYFYLQSYPKEEIFGMRGAEWGGYLQGDAPVWFGVAAVGGMLLFAFGAIWGLSTAAQRWEAKVWEDPGNWTSKALRAMSYFAHLYLRPILVTTALIVIWYFFQEQFFDKLNALPEWIDKVIGNDLKEDDRFRLIGFAVIVLLDLGFLIWGMIGAFRAFLTSFWPEVEGYIVASELYYRVTGRGRTRRSIYRFLVSYSYSVGMDSAPISYTGERVSYNIRWYYQNKPYIWGQTKRYPADATVPVYYNPNKPEDSVLERGIDWFVSYNILLYTIFFFVIATSFLIP